MTHAPRSLVRLPTVVFAALLFATSAAAPFSPSALADAPRDSAAFERPFSGHHWKHRRHHGRHGHAGHQRHFHGAWHRSTHHDHVRHHRKARHRHAHRQHGGFGSISAGNIIGAIIGAAAGSQFGKGSGRIAAILTGTVLGAVVGGKIGESMQEADRRRAETVFEKTPTGQTVEWHNPDTGVRYQVTPTRTYQVASDEYCRDYTSWAFVDGYEEEVRGTACRQSDGRWKLVN